MISLHEGRARLSLDGAWRYRLEGDEPGETLGYTRQDHDDGAWPEMELPTNWYLTEVGDFFGTIWFRRAFRVPGALRGRRLFLRFGAVDYLADVWLNGTYLGHHEGMFNPFEFDVTEQVDLDAGNVVVVKDAAPRDDTEYVPVGSSDTPLSAPYRTHQARAITQIKGHMIDAMHRPGSMTTNDREEPFDDAEVSWQIVCADTGEVMSKGGLTATIPADAAKVVDRIGWAVPDTARVGEYRVEMRVAAAGGEVLSSNATELTVR